MWGYKVADQEYKDTPTLIRYLVRTAGMGANLLLNIGPQPSGDLPATALERLKEMGQWLGQYGETIYGTEAGDFPAQEWGTSTRKGDKLYVHLFDTSRGEIHLPLACKVKKAVTFDGKKPVKTTNTHGGVVLTLADVPADCPDYIIELTTI